MAARGSGEQLRLTAAPWPRKLGVDWDAYGGKVEAQ